MNDQDARLSPALIEAIAGLSAGSAATLAVHPLDVIKTRLQIHRGVSAPRATSLTVLGSLLRSGHAAQSLYRGLAPNLLGNAASWAIFFGAKSAAEARLARRVAAPLSPLDYFVASAAAGLAVAAATNPIWVLKTRMLSSDRDARGAYPSLRAGARAVWAREGWRGFYRGLAASCVGVAHGAVQFAVYEPLKRFWLRCAARSSSSSAAASAEGSRAEKLGARATLLISAAAKLVAGTVTYPQQVVRSRLQTYNADETFGKGIRGVVANVWREEGWRGFYKGLGPNMMRVMPATWVTFLVYENVRYYLLWHALK